MEEQHEPEILSQDFCLQTNVYQEILDETTAQITIIDAKTYEILYANRAALDATKDMPGEYIGSICYEFITHATTPCPHCMIQRAKNEKYDAREVEFGSRTYNQLYKIVKWNGKRAMMEYTEDITEQKQNMAYAQEAQNVLKRILNNIPIGVVVLKYEEEKFDLVELNSSMQQILHLNQSNYATGADMEKILSFTYVDDRDRVREAAIRLKEPGVTQYFEFRLSRRDVNGFVWMSGHAKSVLHPSGAVYIYIGYSNITEQRRANQIQMELESTQKANRAIAEFYSRMSHDMRTPMNGILGLASLSIEESDGDVLRENMAKIRNAGQYLLGLINDTLDLQKIESGKMVLEPQIVSTKDLLTGICNIISTAAEEKGVQFRVVNKNTDLDTYVRLDILRTKQIFINLLSNAVKYTPKGGTVELGFELVKRDGMISHDIISITDTGIGMSSSFLEKGIYQPFSQEKNDITSSLPGTGLGLSITKKLIEMMGGTIDVESEQGSGTSFYVGLDFERVSKDEVAAYRKQQMVKEDCNLENLKGIRILLAEDHPLNAEIVIKVLQKAQCEVVWVKNGEECVKEFAASNIGQYDLILMDIRMPVMDGLQATRLIRGLDREDAKGVSIIAITANAYEEDVKQSIKAGMNSHLSKPIDSKKLYETIAAYAQDR